MDSRAAWQLRGQEALVVLASFAGGLAVLFFVLEQRPGGSWRGLDIAGGVLASSALLARRRYPIVVGVCLAAAAAVCATAGVANYVALFFVARLRRGEAAFAVAILDVLAALSFWVIYPDNSTLSLTVIVNVAISLALVAWGTLQRTQQDLVAVYRDRAARVERERTLRTEQILLAERTRIARDMHDSVAHYISLIALHAGALEVADPATVDTQKTGATIRATAINALHELRTVIGVMRDGALALVTTETDDQTLASLIRQARAAGQVVVTNIDCPGTVVDGNEAVYHIVREGLTNARKHAPEAIVTVQLCCRGPAVEVSVTNPVDGPTEQLPGSGAGLRGLSERLAAFGGVIEHGIVCHPETAAHMFRLQGRVPARD